MKSLLLPLARIVLSAFSALIVYFLLGFLLDKLSGLFNRGTFARDSIETALAFLAPVTFGLLAFVVLWVTFYWFLPKWFFWLRPSP